MNEAWGIAELSGVSKYISAELQAQYKNDTYYTSMHAALVWNQGRITSALYVDENTDLDNILEAIKNLLKEIPTNASGGTALAAAACCFYIASFSTE